MKFKVLRHHLGDKQYAPGDEREAAESDVTHLVRAGVLEPVETKAKGAAPENKARDAAPKTKGK
jgi:hypothetical protein